MPRAPLAVLSLLLALGLSLLPSPARAGDFGEPAHTCSDAVFNTLSEEVSVQCARRDEWSCLDTSGCFNLRRTSQLLTACLQAINRLDFLCYGGTYVFLKVEQFSLQHQIDICSERIAMPEPIGCGKPCRL